MSYIGRGTDKISNVEKLDNISFSGSTATFNLTKGGTAFIPSSAECIRLAIDGIEQGNNYTVSGSQITFDFTPSGSSTNNWIYHIGVGVITTPADGSVTEAKIGSSAVTTAKINDGAVTSGKIASGVIPDAVSLRPNANPLIINGNMAIHQRVSAGTTNESFGVDRFKCTDTANFDQRGFTINQDTDVPTGNGFSNSLKFTMTTPETTIDADEYGRVETILEGQDVQLLKYGTSSAEAVTLSFWVKSNVTGNYAVSLFQEDDTRIIGSTYTVSSSATWEKKVITFSGDTTGVINNDNGKGLSLHWYMSAGSNFTSSDNTSWGASSNGKLAYGQVASVMSTTSGYWYITGVQLEVGQFTSATIPPFQHESFLSNKERCCRYYQNSFILGENPSTSTSTSNDVITTSWSDGNAPWQGMFQVQMRSSPTITLRPRSSTNTGKVSNNGTERVATPQQINEKTVAYINVISGTAGGYNAYNFVLNAEL